YSFYFWQILESSCECKCQFRGAKFHLRGAKLIKGRNILEYQSWRRQIWNLAIAKSFCFALFQLSHIFAYFPHFLAPCSPIPSKVTIIPNREQLGENQVINGVNSFN